jgi:phosphoribosylglycinamide formyltransferase-1
VSRIAVLASGEGTNLQALLDSAEVGPRVVLVVSDREHAVALDRARSAGVEAVYVDPAPHADRDAYGRALVEVLADVDVVALAGFMRILSPVVVHAFEDRIVNVHPSLLPAFPGAHAVREALEWGARVTGVTVHLVDEEVDHGPVLLQESVPVEREDDEATLHARIKRVEHRLFPVGVALVADGRVKVEGRRAHVIGEVG